MVIVGAWGEAARGQVSVVGRAKSDVEAPAAITVKGTFNPGNDPTGLSISGVKAFQSSQKDIQISALNNLSRLPNNAEGASVNTLLKTVRSIANSANLNNAMKEMQLSAAALAATAPNVVGDFARIDKSQNALRAISGVSVVDPTDGTEQGSATARQVLADNKTISTAGTGVHLLAVGTTSATSVPSVSGVAVNRDPSEVDWTSASGHGVTVDLSGWTLSATTAGKGSQALASSDLQVGYLDGTTNLSSTRPTTPVLDVALGVTSNDGGGPQTFSLLSYMGLNPSQEDPNNLLPISDNLSGPNHTGLLNVATDLATELVAQDDGSFAVPTGFSISFDAGGNSPQGTLFVDQSTFGVAAVPEPSSAVLLGAGLVGLALACWRRRVSPPRRSAPRGGRR
jgi:hypothetical protein